MIRLLRLALPLTLVAACTSAAESRSGLAHSAWQFTSIDGNVPVSTAARLDFRRADLSASAGCNAMVGAWRIASGRLIAGPLVQTEMFCAGPVWSQERSLSALLAAAPNISVEGERMVLKSGGHTAELRKTL